ncbi:MAG TPA: porin family protein [Sulfurovum sp.]|uniref:porin family protein n=1 Tax=Sulfurovum sp. TaxID=1969726 RepID=UPI002F952CE4
MKKTTLSIIAAAAMSTFAFAGGDIAPVEPQVTIPEVVEEPESTGAFYVGAGYSWINADYDSHGEHDGDEVLLLAGYNFNPYIGLEARYAGFTDVMENYGIYVKPQYPITDAAKVYALLGYGETTHEHGAVEHSGDGFQWGLGASYAMTENIGVFVDYTNLYDDSYNEGSVNAGDVTVDSVNVGVTYTF